MTYYDSAEGEKITKERAFEELAKHGVANKETLIAFFEQLGDKKSYHAQAVLRFLGY